MRDKHIKATLKSVAVNGYLHRASYVFCLPALAKGGNILFEKRNDTDKELIKTVVISSQFSAVVFPNHSVRPQAKNSVFIINRPWRVDCQAVLSFTKHQIARSFDSHRNI